MDGKTQFRIFAVALLIIGLVQPIEASDDVLLNPGQKTSIEELLDNDRSNVSACDDCTSSLITVRVGPVIFHRSGNQFHVLLSSQSTGQTLLTTSDADPGWAAGPEVDAFLHLTPQTDFEFDWISIGEWNGQGSGNPGGAVVDPLGVPLTSATVSVQSLFRNLECNLRHQAWNSVTLLAGFRYVEFNDLLGLQYENSTTGVAEDTRIQVDNRLWGFQIGTQVSLWQNDVWSCYGWLKAGVFGNAATHSTDFAYTGIPAPPTSIRARDTHAAFVGDLGVRAVRYFGWHTSLYVGYRLMYLDGVALAAHQYDNVLGFLNGGRQTLAINGSVLFQGLDVGVIFTF